MIYLNIVVRRGVPGTFGGCQSRAAILGGGPGTGSRPKADDQHSGSKIIPFIRCVTVGGDLLLLLLLLLLHVLLRLFVELMSLFL